MMLDQVTELVEENAMNLMIDSVARLNQAELRKVAARRRLVRVVRTARGREGTRYVVRRRRAIPFGGAVTGHAESSR
jgi:hypothetical protein